MSPREIAKRLIEANPAVHPHTIGSLSEMRFMRALYFEARIDGPAGPSLCDAIRHELRWWHQRTAA